MTLALEIEYLSGVVYAAVSPASEEADWPPQPDRVFSALVASWAARGQRPDEAAALRWLERLPPPTIHASQAASRKAPVTFVPPNDASTQTEKHARHVWPQSRNRRPRRFPAARPEDSVVRLYWTGVQADLDTFAALQALAADTSYVGHSASLTRCRFEQTDVTTLPSTVVSARRSVYPGRLDALQAAFAAGQRPSSGEWVMPESTSPPLVSGSVFATRWLILELMDDGDIPDIRATALVAKAIRDTLVAGYGETGLGPAVPEVVSGRTPDGQPSHSPHLAVVPLAFVGAPYADGHVLGFALVPPRGSNLLEDPDFRGVLRSLAPFRAERGRRVLTLQVGAGTPLRVSLSPTFEPAARSLDPSSYIYREGRPARTFATVTPIVLDRHPKGTGTARQEDFAHQIAESCRHIGLPESVLSTGGGGRMAVVVDKHAAMEGAPSAKPSVGSPPWMGWRLPPYLVGRPLTHAMIQFAEPVAGPVILGAGRYFGLGLLRPIADPEGSA